MMKVLVKDVWVSTNGCGIIVSISIISLIVRKNESIEQMLIEESEFISQFFIEGLCNTEWRARETGVLYTSNFDR